MRPARAVSAAADVLAHADGLRRLRPLIEEGEVVAPAEPGTVDLAALRKTVTTARARQVDSTWLLALGAALVLIDELGTAFDTPASAPTTA